MSDSTPVTPPDDALPDDILRRVEDDFGHTQAERIYRHLLDRIPDGLPNGTRPRHLRCILHLAQGDESRLEHFIDMCLSDPRDVMLRAEYRAADTAHPVRTRDFARPFDQSELSRRKKP